MVGSGWPLAPSMAFTKLEGFSGPVERTPTPSRSRYSFGAEYGQSASTAQSRQREAAPAGLFSALNSCSEPKEETCVHFTSPIM